MTVESKRLAVPLKKNLSLSVKVYRVVQFETNNDRQLRIHMSGGAMTEYYYKTVVVAEPQQNVRNS